MNQPPSPLAPLVAILGPTGSGKSALGVSLARRLKGEVLVCDSTQVYRGFDIGTAKIPASDRQGVAHHLIDLVDPSAVFHAGEYRRRALATLEDLAARETLPIFTVGTGLYLRGLLDGLCAAPERSEPVREQLARRAEQCGAEYLHRLLRRVDPVSAGKIGPHDIPKMIRAIEVRFVSGKPLSALQRAGQSGLEGYRAIKIGLAPARRALYERIDRRVEAMLGAGWVDEVRGLVAADIPASAKPFQFIGYTVLRQHLEGKTTLERAADCIRQATRRYAKRQITWFRRETRVRWLEGFGDEAAVAEAALGYFEAEMKQ